jgi:hypothetical protein
LGGGKLLKEKSDLYASSVVQLHPNGWVDVRNVAVGTVLWKKRFYLEKASATV